MLCAIAMTSYAAENKALDIEIKSRESEIKKVATDFEGVMISQTLKIMNQGVKVDPLVGGGKAEEIYRDMLMDEYSKEIGKRGGIGLAQHIENDMKRSDTKYKNLMQKKNEQNK